MNIDSPKTLKHAYTLVVLSKILPIGLAASSWVALAAGAYAQPFALAWLILFLILGLYRIFTLYKNPKSLCSYPVAGVASLLRKVSLFLLYVGAIVGLLNLVSRPLMAALVTHRSETGIEFFAVGFYLALLGGIGPLGLFGFEFSRILAFENHAKDNANF